MAEISAAFGTSHTPMLNSPAEDFPKHAALDRASRPLYDKSGRRSTYDELERNGDPTILREITPAVLAEKAARCQAGIARLADAIRDAALDALIVVGDDQHEQFFDDNMPAISLFCGEEIPNTVAALPDDAPEFWKQARAQYHEPSGTRHYPVAAALARHLIDALVEREFDVSVSQRLSVARGEGHAFGFVHRRLMVDTPIPIVPIALNTYYPPNQPPPRRCYRLGQAIRAATEAWSRDQRIGILASGGLSHFVVDEALDRLVLDACRRKDAAVLSSLPTQRLESGSSEIRNWIVVAGAAEQLALRWCDYIPCYRSTAGTGTGVAFATWS
ncbi:MAG: extradiol ring-cleavage dioxygenase [Alphaproteobacteria bacterium]|nr:extradiol ring-cleavage dioxygenase [Alphaproteobacteria bacterium]